MQGTSHPPHSMAGALANALIDLLPDAMMQIGFASRPNPATIPPHRLPPVGHHRAGQIRSAPNPPLRIGPMFTLIDNYDSLPRNLWHFLSDLGAEVEIIRNDAATVAGMLDAAPQGSSSRPVPARRKMPASPLISSALRQGSGAWRLSWPSGAGRCLWRARQAF